MKKYLFLVIIVIFPLLFSASCNSAGNNLATQKADSTKRVNDSIAAAQAAYNNRPWKMETFVDNFGDESKDKFIVTRTEGTFSNSATNGSYLFAEVIFAKNEQDRVKSRR